MLFATLIIKQSENCKGNLQGWAGPGMWLQEGEKELIHNFVSQETFWKNDHLEDNGEREIKLGWISGCEVNTTGSQFCLMAGWAFRLYEGVRKRTTVAKCVLWFSGLSRVSELRKIWSSYLLEYGAKPNCTTLFTPWRSREHASPVRR